MNEELNISNNLEIDKALKEFEVKSGAPQTIPKTPEVSIADDSVIKFEEDKWKQSVPFFQNETPKIVQLVIKWSGGVIKEQKQAEYVLLGVVILAIIVSIFLFFGGNETVPINSVTTPDVLPL